MTDEATPTPMPASRATGSAATPTACQPPIGVMTAAAITIEAASPSMPPIQVDAREQQHGEGRAEIYVRDVGASRR